MIDLFNSTPLLMKHGIILFIAICLYVSKYTQK